MGVADWAVQSLIFSSPRRYGAGPFDSADVFQLVCAELLLVLPRLRNHESVRSWIATVAAHQAYRWKRRIVHRARREGDDQHGAAEAAIAPSNTFEQAERDRVVRAAIAQLPPRDRELVRMLFYRGIPDPIPDRGRPAGRCHRISGSGKVAMPEEARAHYLSRPA